MILAHHWLGYEIGALKAKTLQMRIKSVLKAKHMLLFYVFSGGMYFEIFKTVENQR